MNKKAQLKIQQMAFMLMAVFIFFILVGLFYIVIQSRNLREQATLKEKENAITLANFLAGSAEFSCGDYCIDGDRIMVLKKRTAYQNLWNVSSIEIETIYPVVSKKECNEENYPNCNLIKVVSKRESKIFASSFVSLCKRVEGEYVNFKCELAKLKIGYEVK